LKNNKAIKQIPVSDGFHTLFGVRVAKEEYRTSYRNDKNFKPPKNITIENDFSKNMIQINYELV
jgi:hypothetical protein